MSAVPSNRAAFLIFQGPVIRRAVLIAVIVGPVLALINHGDKIAAGSLTLQDLLKIGLSFLVPFTVSSVSSAIALRELNRVRCQLDAAGAN